MSLTEIEDTLGREVAILGYELIRDPSTRMGSYYSNLERGVTWEESRLIQIANILIAANGGKEKIDMPTRKARSPYGNTKFSNASMMDALRRAAQGTDIADSKD